MVQNRIRTPAYQVCAMTRVVHYCIPLARRFDHMVNPSGSTEAIAKVLAKKQAQVRAPFTHSCDPSVSLSLVCVLTQPLCLCSGTHRLFPMPARDLMPDAILASYCYVRIRVRIRVHIRVLLGVQGHPRHVSVRAQLGVPDDEPCVLRVHQAVDGP